MSTTYHLHCETCHETLREFEVGRWEIRTLLAIIQHASAVAALTPLLSVARGDLSFGIDRGTGFQRLDASWLLHHQGHRLVVIDEYGKIDGRCGARYTCDRCRTEHYCSLPAGHPETDEHRDRII